MNREEKERLERRRRMLARERGEAPPTPPPASKQQPERERPAPERSAPSTLPPKEQGAAAAPAATLRPISPILRRRQRRRRIAVVLVVLIIAAIMAVGSGLLGTSIAMLGDMTDSISLYLNRAGAGWPANTGIRTPTQVEPLAGGFVEMDNEDVAVYSAYGAKIRTIQPGYARPALAVGNTRFVLYNRAGKELTVQSRTRQLYAKSFNNAIMLCEMAQNGTLAVVTESDRYAAEVMVYDASFSGDPFTWKLTSTDGTPIALSFATDNHRFAAATVAARDGQLRTTVRMMNTNSDTAGPFYVADTGSVILKLKWISSSRVLAVFDTYAAIINVSDGTESARYDYGGATLQSVSISGRSTALLLAVRGGDTLVTLDDSLNQLASVAAGQAKSVSSTATAVYLLTASGVESYGYDGTHNWSRDYGAAPQAVINARGIYFRHGRGSECAARMMLCGMGKYGRVMTQYIGIVYDVIFLLLVLGAAEAGRRRGFASGLVSFIGSVAGIIGGTYGTRVWAGGIYDKYVASHVTDVVADTLEKTGGDLAQAIHALTFLPQSIQQKLIDTVSAASSNAVPQVVNALEPLFLPVIQAVVFLSVWIVVRVLCRMLGRVLRGINAIPLIGGLNRILGFAFGFVSGLLNCWIWSILLWVAANLTGGKLEFLTTATLNRSVIYGLLANLNPFLTRY